MIYIVIISLLLMLHYLLFINRIRTGINELKLDKPGNDNESVKISIIIPFRNEKDVLPGLTNSLNKVFANYESLEVIFIDDASDDGSDQVIRESINKDKYRIIRIDQPYISRAHKKAALTRAIEDSKGDIVFLTDADCELPENWINTMLSFFDNSTAMVAGPVTFKDESTTFTKLQKLEYAGLALTGAGLIGAGKPTICSAANLAFRKSVFFEVDGYKDNMNLSSGDDELLMQKIADETNYKVKYCFSKDALVLTRSNNSITEFSQQRKRWASKSIFYRNKFLVFRLILIFLFYMSLLIMPVLAILISAKLFYVFVLLFVGKVLIEYFVMKKGIGIFYDKSLMRMIPLAELLHVPYIVWSSISGLFGGYAWKGRKVRR